MTVAPTERHARSGNNDRGVFVAAVFGAVDVGEGDIVDGQTGKCAFEGEGVSSLGVGGVVGMAIMVDFNPRHGLPVGVGDGTFDMIGGFGSAVFHRALGTADAQGCGG